MTERSADEIDLLISSFESLLKAPAMSDDAVMSLQLSTCYEMGKELLTIIERLFQLPKNLDRYE